MELTFCILLLLLGNFSASHNLNEEQTKAGDTRYLRAFTEYDFKGQYHDFLNYTPDLSVALMDNSMMSYCATGFWILYNSADYSSSNGTVCWLHVVGQCANLSTSCSAMVSSLRYAGSPQGLDDNYYNLYEDEMFQGAEFTGNTDAEGLDDLDLDVSSLIVTGQSRWTFYTGPAFTGTSVCVDATSEAVGDDGIVMQYAYFYTMDTLGLPDNSIRSVRRGCLSNRVAVHPTGCPGCHQATTTESFLPSLY